MRNLTLRNVAAGIAGMQRSFQIFCSILNILNTIIIAPTFYLVGRCDVGAGVACAPRYMYLGKHMNTHVYI